MKISGSVAYPVGAIVDVGQRYVGAGRFENDQWTGGPYTIVGVNLERGGMDYRLVRGVHAITPMLSAYEVWIHHSRITMREEQHGEATTDTA